MADRQAAAARRELLNSELWETDFYPLSPGHVRGFAVIRGVEFPSPLGGRPP